MYNLEELKQKSIKELKEIGWQLNVLPSGDRRCRINWINALAGVQPPLLELLETSPGVEIEPVQEAIEVQRQEPIESKFGRIVYSKPATEPITQNETRPDIDRAESAHLHNPRLPPAQSDGDSSSIEAEALGVKEGDQVLAAAGNHQADRGRLLPDQFHELTANFTEADRPPNRGDNGRDRLDSEPIVSQSAIGLVAKNSSTGSRKTLIAHELLELFKSSAQVIDSPTETKMVTQRAIGLAAKNSIDAEADQEPVLIGIALSDSFLARYSPPQSENIHYKADTDGQLSLLDFEVESADEPPDPDDFELLEDFKRAIARWDSEHPELEISLDSFCEWAPCPDDWYEPSEVLEVTPVIESSSTCNFSIPTFDAWCDRTNRNSDEPPTAGVGARLPKPKPPGFPPMAIVAGDRANHIKKFARSATLLSGRSPPGGDAMM